MHRRLVLAAGALAALRPAFAHHGWSGFDTSQPLWIEGPATRVSWRNPHAELDIVPPADLRLPDGFAARRLPSQSADIDGAALLRAARVPDRRDESWRVELAPLSRLQAWNVAEIRPGETVGVLGYTTRSARTALVLRAEYLFVGGRVYGLRSSPA